MKRNPVTERVDQDLALGVVVFFTAVFEKKEVMQSLPKRLHPTAQKCVPNEANHTESLIFGKLLISIQLKNEQIRDCFYFCPHVENVVNLDDGVGRGFELRVFYVIKF